MLHDAETAAELRNLLAACAGEFCKETGTSAYLVAQWLKRRSRVPTWVLPYLQWRQAAKQRAGGTSPPEPKPDTDLTLYVTRTAAGFYRCESEDGIALTLQICPDGLWRTFHAGVTVAKRDDAKVDYFVKKRGARETAIDHHKWMFASQRGISVDEVMVTVRHGEPPTKTSSGSAQRQAHQQGVDAGASVH